MNLVERIKGILLQPKAEWPVIEREPGDAAYLFPNYVAIVAAIPAVCTFLRGVIIGYGPLQLGFFAILFHAIVIYVLSLASVYVMAIVIDFLADKFGGQKNFANAMRVSAYAPTAMWLTGIFNLIPFLSIFAILGLYSLYLLHTGIGALMRPAADKALLYTVAAIVCVVVLWFVIIGIPAALFGIGAMM